MSAAKKLLDKALKLDDAERTELALRLLDSIEPPDPHADLDDDAWRMEMAARAATDTSAGTPWSEVRARIEKSLG